MEFTPFEILPFEFWNNQQLGDKLKTSEYIPVYFSGIKMPPKSQSYNFQEANHIFQCFLSGKRVLFRLSVKKLFRYFCKIFIEQRNRGNSVKELFQRIVFIRRMDGIRP